MNPPPPPSAIERFGPEPVEPRPEFQLRVVFFALELAEVSALRIALIGEPSTATARLPFGIASRGEPLDEAARRVARTETGITEHYLEQLFTLSRCIDDCWIVIVSSIALAAPTTSFTTDYSRVTWRDVRDLGLSDQLDREVLDYALVRLRAKIGYTTIAFHLLPSTFTMSELQRAYETILDRPLDKRNFRRRMLAAGILEATAGVRRAGSHRPAVLYRFRSSDDRSDYLTPR